jgi:hypothetical protein
MGLPINSQFQLSLEGHQGNYRVESHVVLESESTVIFVALTADIAVDSFAKNHRLIVG